MTEPSVMITHLHGAYNFVKTGDDPVTGKAIGNIVDPRKVSKSIMDKFNGRVTILQIGRPPYFSSPGTSATIVGMIKALGPAFARELVKLIKYSKSHNYHEFFNFLESMEFKSQYMYAPYLVYAVKCMVYFTHRIATNFPAAFSNFDNDVIYSLMNIFTSKDRPPNFIMGFTQDEAVVISSNPPTNYNIGIDIPNLYWSSKKFDDEILEGFVDNPSLMRINPITERSFTINRPPVSSRTIGRTRKNVLKYHKELYINTDFSIQRPFFVNSFSNMEVPLGMYASNGTSLDYRPDLIPSGQYSITLEDALSAYADDLTSRGENTPESDIYIIVGSCQNFYDVVSNTPVATASTLGHSEITSSLFDPYHEARTRRGRPPINIISTLGRRMNVIDRGSARIELSNRVAGSSRRSPYVDMSYVTTDYDSITASPNISREIARSFATCFSYAGITESTAISYFSGFNTVLFYKKKGGKIVFFFSYKEQQKPGGAKPTAYIYNVCSNQAVKTPGFFRKSMRLWVELNMHKYDQIVLGVDMKQPIDRAIRLIRIYGTIGFTPMDITTNIEDGGPESPSSILLSMVIPTHLDLKNIAYPANSEIRLAVASSFVNIMEKFIAIGFNSLYVIVYYYGFMMAGVAPVEDSKTGEFLEKLVKLMEYLFYVFNKTAGTYPTGFTLVKNSPYFDTRFETVQQVSVNFPLIMESLNFYQDILRTISIPGQYVEEIATKTHLINTIDHLNRNKHNYLGDLQIFVNDINTHLIPQLAYMNQRIYHVFKNTNSDLTSL